MQIQNYKNHGRYVIGYHVITFFAILGLLIGSFVNLFHSAKENLYSASLICLIAVIFTLLFWYIRSFAIKAQDRAIRAEENFRHFVLTGKPFPSELKMSQIIALRFAADEEFAALTMRALREGLSNKDIKRAIQQWRGDYHRV